MIGPNAEAVAETTERKWKLKKQIFGLVERDSTRDFFIERMIGFPRIECEATMVGDIVNKIQAYAAKLEGRGSLVIESEFVGVFRL